MSGLGPAPRLVDRRPEVAADQLLAELIPPPRFATVRFETYVPDPDEPTQHAAVRALQTFAARVASPPPRRSWFGRRPAPPEGRAGVYLDGGYGVGKTHLLAALWHVVPAPKVFCTFVELTNLVGAVGFAAAVDLLSQARLLAVDEFELDDPGDTVLVSTLLTRLVEAGVQLAATSNTLPDRLGEGRFAAQDFLREIQSLAGHFDVLRIEGEDYRHRGLPLAGVALTDEQVAGQVEGWRLSGRPASLDSFNELVEHLARVHPSRYGPLVAGLDGVGLIGVRTVADQAVALRLVVLVDRLYDREVLVAASGVPVDQLFAPELLRGGYRKKYFRAVSRLVAVAAAGE